VIRRLAIKGYKSLRAVELTDLSRIVLLYGPNASGKSNLLDALDLLGHLAREDTVTAAFQRHRGNRLGRPLPVRWFFHGTHDHPDAIRTMSFEVDIELHQPILESLNEELGARERTQQLRRSYTRVSRSLLRYALDLEYHPSDRALHVVGESLIPLNRHGEKHTSTVPFIKRDSPDRLSVKLERQAHPRYFGLPRQRTLLSEIGDPVNHPHLVAVARELASIRVYYVEPTRMRSEVSDLRATDPGPHGEVLASFYYWLEHHHPVRYKNLVHNLARLVPGLQAIEVREGSEGFLELWVEEEDRGRFHAAMVSEGTLRLLCLLGITATPQPPAIVGYEEPENGVHPARLPEIRKIFEEATARSTASQFFLTSHSPELVTLFEALDGTVLLRCERDASGSTYTPEDELPLFRRVDREISLAEAPGARRLGMRLARGDID
jgi:predicted ATPase